MRVGSGFDAHRLAPRSPGAPGVRFAGVEVDPTRTVLATSDGDVVAHAVSDALLGAVAKGDIGDMFPSEDPQWHGADSMAMLRQVADLVAASGYAASSLDVTVVAEKVRVAPHRDEMKANLAAILELPQSAVSVKATTTDGMGYLGRDEGVAASAVAVVEPRTF